MSDVDPDIAAAFSETPAAAPASANVDPDIQAAFASSPSQEKEPDLGTYQTELEEAKGNPLVTSSDFWKGAARGALHTFEGATAGNQQAVSKDVAKRLGVSTTPEAIAGEAVGGFFAPLPGGPIAKGAEAVATAAPHPLAAAAEAETGRLAQIRSTGQQAGLVLPEGGTAAQHAKAAATNQPIANSMTRQELNLPAEAPLTPQLLSKARETFASPAYEAIKAIPKIELGPNYEAAMNDLSEIPGEIPKHLKPPEASTATGEGISGAQAVDLSKKLRYRANQYDRQAQLSGNPEASDLAELHRGAAEALEDAVRDHLSSTGQEKLAQDWDAARVYTAKTYSVQNALDGAGNVKVTALKQQLLKNKPLSGNLETLANLGAQYPQAFKLSPVSAPAPGLIKRGIAGALPTIGTGAGAHVFGAPGAVAGKIIGEHLSEKILPP